MFDEKSMDQETFDIQKRSAGEQDFEFARQTHHEAYRDVVERQFGWDEKAQDNFFASTWATRPHEILLCNGEPCGYYALEKGNEFIQLHELTILPEYQGQGIGTRLLKEAIEMGKNNHVPVRLQVLKENTGAIDLYQRMGFKEVDETETHLKMEFREEGGEI